MSTKPKAKSDKSPKKADSKTPTSDTAKSETAAASSDSSTGSSTDANTESSADSSSKSGGGASSAASRPISYFSSVSSDDYRSGWDEIFSSGKKSGNGKSRKRAVPKRAKVKTLPLTITLDADDLDAAVRDQIEAVFRQQVKKKRLNYDKLTGNGQVSWHISCRISDT